MSIPPELLERLVCPLTRAPVVVDGDRIVSTDPATRRSYRIEDGTPVMLVDQSTEVDEETWREIMARHGVSKG